MKSSFLAATISYAILPASLHAGSVAIINGALSTSETGTTSSITTQLQNTHITAGNTVTIFDTPPASLAGFLQVWDIRFSNSSPLTAGDNALYTSFLLGGGGMFLMGENTFFTTRNNSLFSFISSLGGGTIAMASGSSTQTVDPAFNQNIADGNISYNNPGLVGSAGTGRFMTVDTVSGNGSAIVFEPGDLAGAPAGALTVIFDVNWMQESAEADSLQFLENLITFLTETTENREIQAVDSGAISSAVTGLNFLAAQRESALNSSKSALRDVNGRIFRLRAGVSEDSESAPSASTAGNAASGKAVIHNTDDAKSSPIIETKNSWTNNVAVFASGGFSNTTAPLIGESLDSDSYTGTIGGEYAVERWLTLGLAASFQEINGDLSSQLGAIDSSDTSIAAYASHSNQWFYADLLYAYTQSDLEGQRNASIGQTALSNTDAGTHAVELNVGGYWKAGNLTTGPIAALEYRDGQVDSSTESGAGNYNLRYSEADYESFVSRLGWQVSYLVPSAWGEVVPQVRVSWDRENLHSSETLEASLVQSPFYNVSGAGINRYGSFTATGDSGSREVDYLNAGAGVMLKISDQASLTLDYEGNFFASGYDAHYASLRYSWDF